VIAVAFALAEAIVWEGVIILPESLTMGRSPFVTQDKFRHPLAQVNSNVHHISVYAEPVGQGCDVVVDECKLERIPLTDFSLHIHSTSFAVLVRDLQSAIHTPSSLSPFPSC
jgi:hypothetical protein